MTVKEAKRELKQVKDMEKDIKSVELEIERLMTIATKMTASFDVVNVSSSPGNKIEEAVAKIDDYRGRLSRLLVEDIGHKNKCLEKVQQIEPRSLQKLLILYYFQDKTLEQTAELIDKSYQWTYELFKSALEEYAKIS